MEALNITHLHGLLYGYPEYEDREPISKHPSDQVTVHKIRIIPIALAETIAHADPDGRWFHIEYFPNLNHAELWSAFAWRNSLTRHLRIADASRAADPAFSLQTRLSQAEHQIIVFLFHKHPRGRRSVFENYARHTLRAPDATVQLDFLKMFGAPDSLITLIEETRAAFQTLIPTIPSTHKLYKEFTIHSDNEFSIEPIEESDPESASGCGAED